DKFPVEYFSITPGGRMTCAGSVQTIDQAGKYGPILMCAWWLKTEDEFNQLKKQAPPIGDATWEFMKFEKE
ncbi:MAG TPA: hypothetical protein DCZ69_03075, partial [Syntrophobacteraceae bacterium]|nr:hypothetical protein [Syntrophobacteraceae bacterium]